MLKIDIKKWILTITTKKLKFNNKKLMLIVNTPN